MKVELLIGSWMFLKEKSGHVAKHGIVVLGGVVDQNYQGSLKVIHYNTGNRAVILPKGVPFVQGIISPLKNIVLQRGQVRLGTDRGTTRDVYRV